MTTRIDRMVARHPLPTWQPVARLIIVMLSAMMVAAYFIKLDEVSVATGEVVPKGKVRVIQHLEGGIITSMHVREGDVVTAGAPLVQLDLATSGINIEELEIRRDSALLTIARLEAEANGREPEFPPELVLRLPKLAEAERRAYNARRRELESTILVLREQVTQRELEVKELSAKNRAYRKNLALAQERWSLSSNLLAKKLTPEMEHLQIQAEVESLEGELDIISSSIPRARAMVAEAEERIREENIRFVREAEEQLGQTEQVLVRVTELLSQATEQGMRALIRSPVDGVVKNMRFNTIGGVVRPGDPIMEIVPSGEKLVVEAKLNPVDRGYVQVGQTAVVKLTTYDFVRYGGLDGIVTLIAADSTTDPEGAPYFRVVVETEKTNLGEGGSLPITPGMQATVDINTGKKSIMQYLIKPVLKLRHEAFRER